MTVWDPPGHGLDIYHGDRLPEIMAVIPREGPERQASTGPWLPVSRCHLLRYVITRCLAAEPVLYRRRRPLTQLSKRGPRLPRHRGRRLLQRACRAARPRSLPPGQGDHANRWEATFLPLTAARVELHPLPRLGSCDPPPLSGVVRSSLPLSASDNRHHRPGARPRIARIFLRKRIASQATGSRQPSHPSESLTDGGEARRRLPCLPRKNSGT